jgi:hypothetical protein
MESDANRKESQMSDPSRYRGQGEESLVASPASDDPEYVTERVSEGITLLTEYHDRLGLPEWREILILAFERDVVDMDNIFGCVLGILFGSFHAGLTALEISIGAPWGFDADEESEYYSDECDALGREWARQLGVV